MGELLYLALPKPWVTGPAVVNGVWGRKLVRPGLLQQQWGRSLAGGCAYIVLRDMFQIYTKYRRAVTKPMRRVKNVERKRVRNATR